MKNLQPKSIAVYITSEWNYQVAQKQHSNVGSTGLEISLMTKNSFAKINYR